jgi:general secretion pathway protein D
MLAALILTGCVSAVPGQAFLPGFAGDSQVPAEAGLQSQVVALQQSQGDSAAALTGLRRAEEETAARYLIAGTEARFAGRPGEAIRLFELGLAAQPQNLALNEAKSAAQKQKEVLMLSAAAERAQRAGNTGLAQELYRKAELFDRGNAKVLASLRQLDRQDERHGEALEIKAFESPAIMAMNFRNAKLKDALLAISKPYDLNFVFDTSVDNIEVSVSARQATFYQAFQLLLQSGDCFYKINGHNTVVVAKNEKKQKLTGLYFKTFYLQAIKAEKMAEILASSMPLKTVVPDRELNTVQIRASREALNVAERIIAAYDRAGAEILLEVEVLEVNRSKAATLGVDLGSQTQIQPPQPGAGSSTTAAAGNMSVTLPTATLNYLKTNADAKDLSKPRIRTLDGEPATIFVGGKVPLQSATIQQATGQSSTMYEYHDVGIKMEVLPKYNAEGSIAIKLKLEVSSLGQNLGTAASPAYSVGTRNVDTNLILEEGQAAIIGGLVQDVDRYALSQLPGASDLGIASRLFGVDSGTATRTEIVMTVVAHLLRQRGAPPAGEQEFYSGTRDDFTTEDPSGYLKRLPSTGGPLRFRLSSKGQQANDDEPAALLTAAPESESQTAVAPSPRKRPQLFFGADSYSVDQGGRIVVEIRGRNLDAAKPFTTSVLFNPAKLSLEDGAQSKSGEVPAGVVKLTVTPPGNGGAGAPVAKLTFKGSEKGLSYLLLNNPEAVLDGSGNAIGMELGSSKAEIR